MIATHEHSFYQMLTGAKEFLLSFPVDSNGEGPFWAQDGSLINSPDGYQECSKLMMVDLGNNSFRIAENPFLEAPTTLHWGDEVFACLSNENTLELTQINANQRFRHMTTVMRIDAEHPMSKKIHELEGGWECVAGGLVTITIPSNNWDEFESWKSK